MKLSAPIYHLKRHAKLMARDENIPLHSALDRIATREGFKSWSMLSSQHTDLISAQQIYKSLKAGEMVLVGARPGHGKTLLSLEILIEAMKKGNRGLFFSLDYTSKDVAKRFTMLNANEHHLMACLFLTAVKKSARTTSSLKLIMSRKAHTLSSIICNCLIRSAASRN